MPEEPLLTAKTPGVARGSGYREQNNDLRKIDEAAGVGAWGQAIQELSSGLLGHLRRCKRSVVRLNDPPKVW